MVKAQRFGKFILVDRLSVGGMAEVFLAKSIGLGGFEKILAIKRILPTISAEEEFTTMFVDEARISSNLSHVNIAQVFEFGQIDGHYYIAMEYIPGKDLRTIQTHLDETGRVMAVPMALYLATRLCLALDYAHRQRTPEGQPMEIIHRDVSPPNILVAFDGGVKLIDFGIAKAADRSTQTRAGKVKGKFAYMSPEQVQGLPLDQRSDIFSLGVVLHELLTNQQLFVGESQIAILTQVSQATIAPPSTLNPEVPLEVDRIVLQALQRERERRYAQVSELRVDLERYLARSGIVFEPAHLAAWMRTEFAGEIEAERRMKERISSLTLTDAVPGTPADGFPLGEGDGGAREAQLEVAPGAYPRPSLRGAPAAREEQATRVERPSPARKEEELPITAPRVRGPSQRKEQDAIARMSTWLHNSAEIDLPAAGAAEPPDEEVLEQETVVARPEGSSPIAPGAQRDAATVGGALDVDSKPRRVSPEVFSENAVAVEGLEAEVVERFPLPATAASAPESRSGTRQLGPEGRRLSSLQIIVLAAILTLVLLGALALVLLLFAPGGEDQVTEAPARGTILVSTAPSSSCSISLGAEPRGMLQPGATLRLSEVEVGRHLITLECVGFQTYVTSVDVNQGQVSFVVAELKRHLP